MKYCFGKKIEKANISNRRAVFQFPLRRIELILIVMTLLLLAQNTYKIKYFSIILNSFCQDTDVDVSGICISRI